MIVHQFSQASVDHSDRCEDAVLAFHGANTATFFAIIDGLGGHQHHTSDGEWITGRDAAELVRDVLMAELRHLPLDVDASPGGLAEQCAVMALTKANLTIYEELNLAQNLPLRKRVGAVATVVVVCEQGMRLLSAQVGDTRAYVYSGDELVQLGIDEDNIEFLVMHGLLSDHDAVRISAVLDTYDGINDPPTEGEIAINGRNYPLNRAWQWFMTGFPALQIPPPNIVINSLGIEPDEPAIQVSRVKVAPGDKLLMCTDGLYKNLTLAEIVGGLRANGDTASLLGEAAYARSQDRTNGRRTPDDISMIVAQF